MSAAPSSSKAAFDKTSLMAYGGVAAAVAFIVAMTIGMIESPSNPDRMEAAYAGHATEVVSVAGPDARTTSIR